MHCTGCPSCTLRAECGNSGRYVERVAKWGGSALSFLGSLLLATTKGAGSSPFVFLLLVVASGAWTVAGVVMRDRALVASSLLGVAFNLSATLIRL
ncbi:MAG: hypothetical protein PHY45_14565 [Rhodocyclaceae bacterium]|nr:hypothetical protein [Rhodocyclaceae bacterium]